METVLHTEFPSLKLFKRGKVRDIYDLDENLLFVTTDRISAFDVILLNGIPDKGKILTQISEFWFKKTEDIISNHLISCKVEDFPNLKKYGEILHRRSMVVKKTESIPVECVVRGYLYGSGWEEYKQTGRVCGIELGEGLKKADRLEPPLFTPTTKAEYGEHDRNISYDEMSGMIGSSLAERIKEVCLSIYTRGCEIADKRGLIIADTKFEFGTRDGELLLIDELLTPDSSRFWPKEGYEPGGVQKSFDKQFVRDYLLSIEWDKTPIELPKDIVTKTEERYTELLKRITGKF